MRKGRSHRRPRGSLPPISQKSQGSSLGGGVHVVVGLSGPQGQAPDSPEEAIVKADARSNDPEVVGEAAPVAPPKSLELVRQDNSLEIVRESLELVRETLDLQLKDEPSGPDLPQIVESAPLPVAHVVPEPFALVVDRERGGEEREEEGEESPIEDRAPTPMVHVTSIQTPDEISIPPAGDLVVEPAVEQFFSEGDLGSSPSHLAAVGDEESEDEWGDTPRSQKAKLKASPEAIARRAKFSRYVSFAVAGAAIVCVAAFVRSIAMPGAAVSAKAGHAVSAVARPAEKAAQPVAVAPAQAPAAPVVAREEPKSADPAPAAEPKAPEPKVADTKVEEPKAATPAPSEEAKPAAAVSDKTALEEKKICLRALERGKLAESIEAGERSVALDPTDGEAWLLLGAAYQQKGNGKDARRCYAACLKEGKRGPLGECRAMLR